MERLKETITDYWTQRAEGFQEQRIREFESEKHKRWMEEFHKYLPTQKPLRILDLGTGTGFFAFLLAEEGHTVTGIDLTPDMIKGAKQTANRREQLKVALEQGRDRLLELNSNGGERAQEIANAIAEQDSDPKLVSFALKLFDLIIF